MTAATVRYDANLSILFTELPLLERPAAAAAAGFDAVEFWWPFPMAVPADSDIEAFVRAITDAGVQLVALNFWAGDMAGGERGLLSSPVRSAEFVDNIDVVIGLGERLGCKSFNALYGNRLDSSTPEEQDDIAAANLARAAAAAARINATVLVEPLSGAPQYPLRTAADVIGVLERVVRASGVTNVKFLCDLYHLATNGEDLAGVIAAHAHRIGHVQIADSPGRNEPGTGTLDIATHLAALSASGYAGYVGLEYKPRGTTLDSLNWLPREQRRSRS